jgi:ubiquinone/menaquinone biosynthesis C-methylase UbiE
MDQARHRHHHRANMFGVARHAVGYERHARLVAGPLYRRVARDVGSAGLAAGAVVLDVGTGPGSVPRLIAADHPELTLEGVDLSAEMIALATHAAQTGQAAGAPSVGFQVGDVAALPYRDESVDLVISSLSLHHWEDPAAGLREVVRVLRPGGRAWVYDFRRTLRRYVTLTTAPPAEVSLESPLRGTFWFNPIGRLVIRRRGTSA